MGDWDFDLQTGELFSVGDPGLSHRLPPQPTKLLALLLAKNGELLSREEIREAIWPDVEVELDQSLAFCVRQVRQALGDSAEAPSYIETLPRRGYRLMPELLEPPVRTATTQGNRRSRLLAIRAVGILVMVAVTVAAVWAVRAQLSDVPTSATAPRLAIMPFAPPPGVEFAGDPTLVAHRLLASLGAWGPERLQVVGPTTTEAYASDPASVQRLARERQIDLVINGRFFVEDSVPELLAELIRASDGAHIWVRRYPEGSDWSRVAGEIDAAIRDALVDPD